MAYKISFKPTDYLAHKLIVQEIPVIEVDIDGRTFWVPPVGSWVLESGNVVAQGLAVSLDKPLEWAVGFLFGNVELSPLPPAGRRS
jgi:hypothetical protein